MAKLIEEKLHLITSIGPKSFEKQLTRTLNKLGIQLLTRNAKTLMEYIEFVDFLQKFSNTNLTVPFQILEKITEQRKYLKDSALWYDYMTILHADLSQYHVQLHKNNFDGSSLMNAVIIDENLATSVSELGIKSTIEPVSSNLYMIT